LFKADFAGISQEYNRISKLKYDFIWFRYKKDQRSPKQQGALNMKKKAGYAGLTITLLIVSLLLSFNLACSKKADQAKKHFDQAVEYEDQKMPDEAIKEYKQAIQLDPKYAEAHFRLGALYHTVNAFSSAIDEYQKVVQIDPHYPGIYTAMGHVYYVRGMSAWVKAMKLDQMTYWQPDTSRPLPPYRDKAELLNLIKTYQNGLKTDTTDAELYSKLSQANYILAVDEYRKAKETNPSDTSAILYLALTYSEQGYPQKATTEYENLQKVDPRAAAVLQKMFEQKEKEKAYYESMKNKGK
jgi:tetratricopeptide (TPR) repeat protein